MASLAPLLKELLEKHRAGSRTGSVNTDVPGVHLIKLHTGEPNGPNILP